MNRLKEKAKAIWHILKGGQYAVYVINDEYVVGGNNKGKICCVISDNASDLFLETIVDYTDKVRTELL